MAKGELVHTVTRVIHTHRLDRFSRRELAVAILAEVEPLIRADERERLAQAWRVENHGVRFNHAHDDLTPAQRVEKWIRGAHE